MTKNKPFTAEQIRKEQELRLYAALEGVDPGTDAYTKILAQISALNSHARAVELKEAEYANDETQNRHAVDVEYIKQNYSAETERQKIAAAKQQKQYDLAGKLITVAMILVFEHSGHAIISKSFGLIRD